MQVIEEGAIIRLGVERKGKDENLGPLIIRNLKKLKWSVEKKGIRKARLQMKNKTAHSRNSCANCFKEFPHGILGERRHCQSNTEVSEVEVSSIADLRLCAGPPASCG